MVRVRRAPDPRLRGLLTRELLGYHHAGASFGSWLEAARPELTLMIDLDGWINADGESLPDAWIGGLGDRPTLVGFDGAYGAIDLKLRPLGAYTLTGLPLSELAGACVGLEEVFGSAGRRLVQRLRETTDWQARFDLLERFLLTRMAAGPAPTPAVAWAWRRLCDTGGTVRIEALAAEIGCSRRYLSARMGAELGLPPKTLARLVRFHAVRERIARRPEPWAAVAAAAGYADESHLHRDFRAFAGTTPGDFVARLLPTGGVIGDAL